MRTFGIFLLLALAAVPTARAGSDGLTGNWLVTIFDKGQKLNFWILKFEAKGGKIGGSAVSLHDTLPSTVSDIQLKDDLVTLNININNRSLSFQGRLSKNGDKAFGSLTLGHELLPTTLDRTKAQSVYELDREFVARSPEDPRAFHVTLQLIARAAKEKELPKEVERWAVTSISAAERFGERWRREIFLRIAEALVRQDAYSDVAVTIARGAERFKGPPEFQAQALTLLAMALKKAGKKEEAQMVTARADKLESAAYEDYSKTSLPFKVTRLPGRKGTGKRAVLVELFTGAQCPPCVAADLAFDAVEKGYPASEVVLLQYHMHIPGPDALANLDAERRFEYYQGFDKEGVRGTPTVFFNGKRAAPGGGGREEAQEKFDEFRKVIDPLLQKPAGAGLQARAFRKADKVHIRALASDIAKPGLKMRLRLALVEDWVRYRGSNGLRYHTRVVRAMPGGANGLALTKKENEQTVVVDLSELERNLERYLDNFAKNEAEFPDAQRPMRFRDLRVVAFVQNDEDGEVLQALDVPVKDE